MHKLQKAVTHSQLIVGPTSDLHDGLFGHAFFITFAEKLCLNINSVGALSQQNAPEGSKGESSSSEPPKSTTEKFGLEAGLFSVSARHDGNFTRRTGFQPCGSND